MSLKEAKTLQSVLGTTKGARKMETAKTIKIRNPWHNKKGEYGPEFYTVSRVVFTLGEFRIFEQFRDCYLHTFKDIAITQRVKPNKEGVEKWNKGDFSDVMDYLVEINIAKA
jgi:hypothetical protein